MRIITPTQQSQPQQNEQNIDMCIVANRSFYPILFGLEE
jgi:hypothetical protein